MSDNTAVLVTKVPGELQLYFASIIQNEEVTEAKITLITGHKLLQNPEHVALRQNCLVYLVGKLVEKKRYKVESILSLLKNQLEKYDFLEAVILNDIALKNYSEKKEKEEEDLEEGEGLEEEEDYFDEEDPTIEPLVKSTAELNITTPLKPTTAEVNPKLPESTDVPADRRTSYSSDKRPPTSEISSWHVFFPGDVIQGMHAKSIEDAIGNIRNHPGYSDLMHLVKQSKLSVSFIIRKVLHLRKKAINLVTIGECKSTLMRIDDSVQLQRLNYLNLSDITRVEAF